MYVVCGDMRGNLRQREAIGRFYFWALDDDDDECVVLAH